MSTPAMFQQLCASCHGDNLKGTDKGANLLAETLKHGGTKVALINTITNGVLDKGMPAWKGAVSTADIDKIAAFIINKRKAAKK